MSYKRLPGTARRYIDTSTREVLSRRQVDQRRGELFESGFNDYGSRKASIAAVETYTNKLGEPAVRYDLRGVTDLEKAMKYVTDKIGADPKALYSVRVKINALDTGKERKHKGSDKGWRSVPTSDLPSLSEYIEDFMSAYVVDTEDFSDIELVILDYD